MRRGSPGADRTRSRPLGRTLPALTLLLALATGACDNIVKYVPYFATMSDGPAEQAYERAPVAPPEGAVPVGAGDPAPSLPVADTALRNPLAGTASEIERGRATYEQFCLPCHGPGGAGDGPVINRDGQHPRRLPYTPAVDLTSGTAPERSDGYIWGMIENGRGLMPAYDRIPEEDRWPLVEYVRHLQRSAGGSAGPADAGGSGGDR